MFPTCTVNHKIPRESNTAVCGSSAFSSGIWYTFTSPLFGSSFPIYPFPFPVNQIFPLASATNPCGPESSIFSVYSLNVPLAGSSRPSLFCNCSVNHSDPSGATAGSCGCAPFVGTSHSLILTFSSPTLAPGTRAAITRTTPPVSETPAANKIPQTKINPAKIVIIRLLMPTSTYPYVCHSERSDRRFRPCRKEPAFRPLLHPYLPASEPNNTLAPFHRICTPMHTSKNDDNRMITLIPVAPSNIASRSANP